MLQRRSRLTRILSQKNNLKTVSSSFLKTYSWWEKGPMLILSQNKNDTVTWRHGQSKPIDVFGSFRTQTRLSKRDLNLASDFVFNLSAKIGFHAVCDCSNYRRALQFWIRLGWKSDFGWQSEQQKHRQTCSAGSHLLLPSLLIPFDIIPNTPFSSWDGLGFWVSNINNQPQPHVQIYWLRHLAAIVTRLVMSGLSVLRVYLGCLCVNPTEPKHSSFNCAGASKVYLH